MVLTQPILNLSLLVVVAERKGGREGASPSFTTNPPGGFRYSYS